MTIARSTASSQSWWAPLGTGRGRCCACIAQISAGTTISWMNTVTPRPPFFACSMLIRSGFVSPL
jgi:hypothetical protein